MRTRTPLGAQTAHIIDDVKSIQQIAHRLEGDASVATTAQMDFSKSKKVADQVGEWTKRKSLDLYKESKERNLYPWEVLEEMDPSPTNLAGDIISPLDAMERCLYSLGINLRTTTVDQFFAGPGMVLMPAIVTRWLNEGIRLSSGAQGLFAFDRPTSGMTAHPLFLEGEGAAEDAARAAPTSTDDKRLGAVGTGSNLPVTRIGYRDKSINIGTYGRDLQLEYKFVKYATMQELRIIFLYIGMNIAWDDRGNIFEIIDAGDGVSGAPPSRLQISGAGGAGTLVFKDLLTAIVRMNEGGFQITHWVGEADSLIDFLGLSQFSGANERDQTLQALLSQRGPIATPLGVLVTAPNPPADVDHLGFWDSMFAVARAEEQKLTVEADKIIQGLLEEIAIHGSWAFYKFLHDSSGMVDYSA